MLKPQMGLPNPRRKQCQWNQQHPV